MKALLRVGLTVTLGSFLFTVSVFGQSTGNIEGVVVNKTTHDGLAAANVVVIGTHFGASTKGDGHFLVEKVPPGSYQIKVSFIGYEIGKQSISVQAGETLKVNFALASRPLELDEIRVEAIRDRAEQPMSVDVITETEINDSRHASAYDIFKDTPGVHVMQGHTIGFGLASRPAGRILIRGLGRRAGGNLSIRGIQILVDGIPDFSQTHGHPFPDVHAVDNIEKMEIIKGPATVRYGNAMSGVIVMTTKTPDKGVNYNVKSSAGSFATTENVGRLGYGGDKGFAQVSGNVRHTGGHRKDTDDQLTAFNGSVKAGYDLSENLKISANGLAGRFEWDNPGLTGNPGGETNWAMGDMNLKYTRGQHDASIKLWGLDGTAKFRNGTEEPNTQFGIKSVANLTYVKGGKLTFGFDWINYNVGRETASSDLTQGKLNEVAPYFLVTQKFSPQLLVETGVRFTHNEQFGEDLSPEIGLVYKPQAETSVRGRIAHGFRRPNAFETTFGGNANKDLDAADMWQLEAGVNHTFEGRVTVDITGFLQEGNNMIRSEPDPSSPSGSRLANSGEFSHKGIEAAISLQAAENLSFSATTTNLDLEDDTALAPHNVYTVGMTFTPRKLSFELNGQWVTGLYNNDNRQNKLDNYFVLDFQGSYRISRGFSIFAAVDNLFDERYELVGGFPRPGTSIFAGFRVNGLR